MPEFLEHHPGLLFVIATLLPMASFLILLLTFAVRSGLRSSPEGSFGATLYQALGGDRPSVVPAYIATGAIALAFACSLAGLIIYVSHHDEHEAEALTLEDKILKTHGKLGHFKDDEDYDDLKKEFTALSLQGKGADRQKYEEVKQKFEAAERKVKGYESEIKQSEERLAVLKGEWEGRLTWASVGVGDNAKRLGTALTLGYRIDTLAALMFVMVTFIASLIHVFSMGYMAEELHPEVADHQVHTAHGHLHRRGRFGRFFMYLSLFCFSMLNLVLADNLFQVFISWELVGVCSYLLIGFYFERQSASNAANKAFITNRIGDAGFVIGLLVLWTQVGTFNFEEIFSRIRAPLRDSHGPAALGGRFVRVNPDADTSTPATAKQTRERYHVLNDDEPSTAQTQVLLYPLNLEHYHNVKPGKAEYVGPETMKRRPDTPDYGLMPYWMLVVAGLGIFLGCVGKSAQFPLQVWLPDAMEGPTPVSALIHAATMVAAGVYLVGRCYPIFTAEALLVIAYTGAITLFVAATIAIVMTDIKKVLAYSTVSQLGYMMLALGVGGWVAGLFHLFTHAFFKALLFLGSGSVIYGCHHEQEMTKMGGLYPKMKITALTMLSGCLAIAGLPLFSGWYSKDAILAQALGFVIVHKEHVLLLLLPLATAGITTFYMARMWLMTFTGKPRDEHVYEHAHESPWLMTVPLIALAVMSVVVAWGWPVYDAEASMLESHIHHAQHASVMADFGFNKDADKRWDPNKKNPVTGEKTGGYEWTWLGADNRNEEQSVRVQAAKYHHVIGNIALGIVALAVVLALSVYYFRLFDPADAREQFLGVYRFLTHKWYFDEAYSVLLVRPALTVANWCRWFDTRVIDGFVDNTARFFVWLARGSGRFDRGVIDGLVNVIGDTCYAVGAWLRNVQTGYLRSYVVFLVVAATGIWVVLWSLFGTGPGK
jgi:NADH-quinone oxidoreductase subunit L